MWLPLLFVSSLHDLLTVLPQLITGLLTMPGSLRLLQETLSLFGTVPPWEYGIVLLRIMNLFSHHGLWGA